MIIIPVPALQDNYMYIIVADKVNLLVDPVEPKKIQYMIDQCGYPPPTAILTTHHHGDHAGGNLEALNLFGKMDVYGGDKATISQCTIEVGDQTILNFGNLQVTCIHTPCHTTDHICYYIKDGTEKAVFTGDTLFLSGCGRFFEGDAEQMDIALNKKLTSLPESTKVYCGHEYTVQNLQFCSSIEPRNERISDKLKWAIQTRAKGQFTVPSTIADELECNVFMRVNLLKESFDCETDAQAMDLFRAKKNSFRS